MIVGAGVVARLGRVRAAEEQAACCAHPLDQNGILGSDVVLERHHAERERKVLLCRQILDGEGHPV